MGVADLGIETSLVAVEVGLELLRGTDFALLGNKDRLAVLERLERVDRMIPGIGHELVAELEEQRAVAESPYGGMSSLLAHRLHVRYSTARRMMSQSALLSPRCGISGAVVPAVYPLVGAAQRDGLVNADHVGVILKFFRELPATVCAQDRCAAEVQLVELAKVLRPEEVEAAARRLMAHLNPDGSLDDERERRKAIGFWMGPQDADGLTRGTFCFDARLRALVEAFFAKFAKPGMCNPEDEEPVTIPEPPPTPPPPAGAGPARRRRPRPRRQCPTCGGEVGEDGKAATAPGADAESDGPDDGAVRGHSAGDCSGPCGRSDPGPTQSGPGRGPEHNTTPEPAQMPEPVPEPVSDPMPEFEAEPVTEPESETDVDAVRELDLGLPPALAPALGLASGLGGGAAGFDAEALAAAAAVDMRPWWLRNVDALTFGFEGFMGDPALGQHRGLPVTAVVTMTLKDLEECTGKALSGGGALIPIRDAVRMAAHAHPYLLIFDDDGRPLYLGRGKRLASADQRLVLYAGDRGCTFPTCPRPGYLCQSHHIDEWAAKHGGSDIDRLTFACEEHHPLVGPGPDRWATTTAPPGGRYGLRTIWHPPGFMDPLRLGMVNHFHHPEEYLLETPEFPGPDGEPPPQRE